jgi:hypothetical protein
VQAVPTTHNRRSKVLTWHVKRAKLTLKLAISDESRLIRCQIRAEMYLVDGAGARTAYPRPRVVNKPAEHTRLAKFSKGYLVRHGTKQLAPY